MDIYDRFYHPDPSTFFLQIKEAEQFFSCDTIRFDEISNEIFPTKFLPISQL